MIVTSCLSEKKYFWVKVPRTATHSYQKLFFPELHQEGSFVHHTHTSFSSFSQSSCVRKPQIEYGVSVVRNPYDRFISGLKYLNRKPSSSIKDNNSSANITRICEFCGEITYVRRENILPSLATPSYVYDWLKNEDAFYDFIYSHFEKNFLLKSGYTWEKIFHTNNTTLVQSIVMPQMFFAYHPKVKIFHYEKLSEFNDWIETTLGIPTSKLTTENTSKNKNLNIDFTTKKFKDLVYYLYKDDFKVFGYS